MYISLQVIAGLHDYEHVFEQLSHTSEHADSGDHGGKTDSSNCAICDHLNALKYQALTQATQFQKQPLPNAIDLSPTYRSFLSYNVALFKRYRAPPFKVS